MPAPTRDVLATVSACFAIARSIILIFHPPCVALTVLNHLSFLFLLVTHVTVVKLGPGRRAKHAESTGELDDVPGRWRQP